MVDRDHIDPLALEILLREWGMHTPRSMLTQQASDTLAAVASHGFEMCVGYKDGGGALLKYPECTKHGPCAVKTICRAWRGTQREKKDE